MARPVELSAADLTFELEAQMTEPAAAFARRWWGRATLDVIAREVVTPGAIADLVGCSFDSRRLARRCENGHAPILQWAPLACVAACEQPLTTIEIARVIGMSVSGARKAVAAAIAHGALERDDLLITRNPEWASPIRRLAAIELKLTDWRRALQQAEVYSQWADEAWLVLARSTSESLQDSAAELGVGLAFLEAGSLIVVERPRARRHAPFTVARLLAGEQAFAQAFAERATKPTATGRGAVRTALAF